MLRLGSDDGRRIAVLADVHANAGAYRQALERARTRGFDVLVILGDLFTYGCEPLQVLELTLEAVARDGAKIVKGNHDQIYLDLQSGACAYYERLPGWIKESVDWTLTTLARVSLAGDLPWQERIELDDALFAHAGPHPYGDWSYVDRPEQVMTAARELRDAHLRLGVFGHSHRRFTATLQEDRLSRSTDDLVLRRDETFPDAVVINPGSVGQPRDREKSASFVLLSLDAMDFRAAFEYVSYDRNGHLDTIRRSSISEATQRRLQEYY